MLVFLGMIRIKLLESFIFLLFFSGLIFVVFRKRVVMWLGFSRSRFLILVLYFLVIRIFGSFRFFVWKIRRVFL